MPVHDNLVHIHTLELNSMYLSDLWLDVTSSALAGLNAFFWFCLNFLMKDQVGCSGNFICTVV